MKTINQKIIKIIAISLASSCAYADESICWQHPTYIAPLPKAQMDQLKKKIGKNG